MRPILRILHGLLFVLVLTLPSALRAQDTRIVSGVVIDAASGAPVPDVLVTVEGTRLRAVTDSTGSFRIAGVPLGRQPLILNHVAYGEHGHTIVVDASAFLDFRIQISSRAIELAPMTVNVVSEAELARRSSGNSVTAIDRPRIEEFTRRGGATVARLLEELPGIHLNDTCVEYRLSANNAGIESATATGEPYAGVPCQQVAVYLDGMWTPQGAEALQTLALQDLEHIEVLSPSEAGVRYANGAHGVILVQTRRGVAQTEDRQITITGFGWSEDKPYPWLRAVGVTALGNAATVALTYAAVDCVPSHEAFLSKGALCSAAGSVGAALFTSAVSSLVTRWAGGTSGSRGRTLPAAALGTVTASVGYVLRVYAKNHDSSVARAAGHVVLAAGVPLTLTLSDRVFRVLR